MILSELDDGKFFRIDPLDTIYKDDPYNPLDFNTIYLKDSQFDKYHCQVLILEDGRMVQPESLISSVMVIPIKVNILEIKA